MLKPIEYGFWGVMFALLPGLMFGTVAGIVLWNVWVGVVVGAIVFLFGLDVLFGKGTKCLTQYKR